jgi:hypothetical protein
LRVGVLVGAPVVPGWVAEVLRDLRTAEFAKLATVVLIDAPRPSWWRRLGPGAVSAGLLRLYEAAEAWLFRSGRGALSPVDVGEDLRRAGVLRLDPAPGRSGAVLAEADARRLEAADLDVLLNFCAGPAEALPVGCARYGVWTAHAGDSRVPRAGPPLFREVLEREPVSAAEVHVRGGPPHSEEEGGAPRVICRAFAGTRFRSLCQTRDVVYWKSAELLLRCLRDLHARGWDSVRPLGAEGGARSAEGCERPGALRVSRFLGGQLTGLVGEATRRLLTRKQWLLAVRPAGDPGSDIRLVRPPRGHCYADPFLWAGHGKNYVFFEEYRFDRPKGVISCIELDPFGNPAAPRVVLERDYHLSYPFVFEWQGQTYMLPETSANRAVELYRAVEFPHRWEPDRVLMEGVALTDPTLVEHGGRYWLFASPRGQAHSVNDELNVYFADNPLGPWRPHTRNPVVADVRRARPAGRVVRANGRLVRPAQDCSLRYGYAVSFQRLDVLTETEYEETCVGRIEPGWLSGNLATHTYNRNEAFEVVDALLKLPRFRWLTGPARGWGPSARVLPGSRLTTPLEGVEAPADT